MSDPQHDYWSEVTAQDAGPAEAATYTEGLNDDQRVAFGKILTCIKNGQHITKLVGYAGTGKTFLVARLARYLADTGDKVTVCAPTHKAVGVISEKLGDIAGVDSSTLHSLLGMKLQRDLENDTGGHLVKSSDGEKRLEGVIICDEASMIGTVLLEEIRNTRGCLWLFVGDSAQLPPIGESESALLRNPDAVLSTVVRQKGDSEILDLATAIREGDRGALRTVTGDKDVLRVASGQQMFEAALARFKDPAFEADPTFARVLVFRNKIRREINDRMRELCVGAKLPYVEGEWLVLYDQFSSPADFIDQGTRLLAPREIIARADRLEELREEAKYASSRGDKSLWRRFFAYRDEFESVRLHTSQEVRVTAVLEDVADLGDWCPTFDIWLLSVWSLGTQYFQLPVLKESGPGSLYEKTLDDLRGAAISWARRKAEAQENNPNGYKLDPAWKEAEKERKNAWRRFYLLKEMFANLDYCFAMTVHKAQGSTFEHTFVDLPDLISSPQEMRQKLLYTAVTRPSKTLTFYYA